MHAVWTLLLDDDFKKAYEFGMVVRCADGVERRIYPRFFTYAADYPERSASSFEHQLARPSDACCQGSSRHDQEQRALPLPLLLHREDRSQPDGY